MYIQIDNVGFVNKGAELMLYAIIDRLSKEKDLNPKFVAGKINGTPEQIRKAGLYQIPNTQRFKIKLQNLYTQPQLDKLGLVKRKNINVLLDAGGFQFSDQFKTFYNKESNNRLFKYYKYYRKNKCKIIFLPQSFGPFEDPIAKERMEIIFEFADLIYSRDNVSYNHLRLLFGDDVKIKLAPDFTNLVNTHSINLSRFKLVKDKICIIPNSRMVTHTPEQISTKYLSFLISICRKLSAENEHFFLLNHEGAEDWKLILKLREKIGSYHNLECLNDLSSIEIKAVIGTSKMVVTSRFHGAVNALNQRIPVLVTSWSHKYWELLKDFGLNNSILNPLDEDNSSETIFKCLRNPTTFLSDKNRIDAMKRDTMKMWKDVIRIIVE